MLEANRSLVLRNVKEPVPGPGWAVVDVRIAGIGGSEYLGYNTPGLRPLPSIMGHGIAGLDPTRRRVAVNPLMGCGACAYCRQDLTQLCDDWHLIGVQSDGGLAEKVAVPQTALVPLPDSLSWAQSAFIEPFANAINAWDLSGAGPPQRIGIIGAGSLGLGVVARAHRAGCREISIADLSEPRRKAARALGASTAAPALAGDYDAVFDTVGSIETRSAGLAATRKGGSCVLLGFASPAFEVDGGPFIRQQKRLIGSFVYSPAQFQQAVKLAECAPENWVDRIGFEDVEPLLQRYLAGDFTVIKAALSISDP